MKTKIRFFITFLVLGIALSAVIVTPGQADKADTQSEETLTCAGECLVLKHIPTEPFVTSVVRSGPNPTDAEFVGFEVTFSESVTGVDIGDFIPVVQGVGFALVTNVSGSGSNYTVSVYTGYGNGTLSLDVVDYDLIADESGERLGGVGIHNGDFRNGETYIINKSAQ